MGSEYRWVAGCCCAWLLSGGTAYFLLRWASRGLGLGGLGGRIFISSFLSSFSFIVGVRALRLRLVFHLPLIVRLHPRCAMDGWNRIESRKSLYMSVLLFTSPFSLYPCGKKKASWFLVL